MLENQVVFGHIGLPFVGRPLLFGLSQALMAHHLLSTLHYKLLLGVLVLVLDFELGAGLAGQSHLVEDAILRVLLRLDDGLGDMLQRLLVQ